MNNKNYPLLTSVSLLLFSLSSVSFADGITDLNRALEKLNGQTPISARFESSYIEDSGKKKKMKTTSGQVQVFITDDVNGLQINYSHATLQNAENEANAKEKDEEVNTPTLNAINDIEATELRNMLSAAASITRTLKKATFINEQAVDSDNQQTRVLNFSLPLEAIIDNKEVRGYVDDFKGKYSVTIDEDGTPLNTTLFFEGKGRAYIIFSLALTQTNTSNYIVVGNRLIKVKEEFERKQDSTWGKRNSSGYKELTLTTNEAKIALLKQ